MTVTVGPIAGNRRSAAGALIALVIAAGLAALALAATEGGATTALILARGPAPAGPGSVEVSVPAAILALAGACAAGGLVQLARPGARGRVAIVLGLPFVALVLAVLVWAARGSELYLPGLVSSSLLRAVPIGLGALAGVVCERSGVINIGIEGQMVGAAFFAALVASLAGSVLAGLAAGLLTGALLGWLLGLLAIRFRLDQIIAGFAINILALGLTSYLALTLLEPNPDLNAPGLFGPLVVPVLAELPVVGPVLFAASPFLSLLLLATLVTHVVLYRTRWGLRVRAVGEHPRSADAMGVDPLRIRYQAVVLGGLLAGAAGAYFVLGSVGRFDQGMTAGRGFIALVAMIVGGWRPVPAFLAAWLFGFADSSQTLLGVLNAGIPPELLLMTPYVATILVVAGAAGRTRPPAADGQPYLVERRPVSARAGVRRSGGGGGGRRRPVSRLAFALGRVARRRSNDGSPETAPSPRP